MKTVAEIFGIETITENNYKHALTHSSYTKENNLDQTECYERLEFLGDAVLKLTISDILYKNYPDSSEGELSKIRSIVVSDNTLATIAKENGLQNLIIMSKHEEKQGCRKLNSICACAFEAILGAYYLDGKFEEIKTYIEKNFKSYIEDVDKHFEKYNAKALLQEYTQSKTKETPTYTIIEEKGPQHKKEFKIQVRYNGETLAEEIGLSKKEAEQKYAYSACKKLGLF